MRQRSPDMILPSILTEVKFSKRILATCFHGRVVVDNGEDDPAGLCDGVDYIKEIQIRIDDTEGNVYISIRPRENSEWWFAKMSWGKFFQLMMQVAKNNKEFRHNLR